MKRILLLTGLIGSFWLCYALFQNAIDHSFGWRNIPSEVFEYSFQGKLDAAFQSEIHAAQMELKKVHSSSKAPAVSIAVSVNQKIVWSAAAGLRNIASLTPADTATQFRIGSTSKALTSLGLGKLMDQSAIQLDSSIQYYTDHFKNKPRIKIRQLASHQSGIRNYGVCLCLPVWEYYRDKYFSSVEESLADFEDDKLLFEPGEQFSYSSYNFTALSHAMEEAASEDFLSFMHQQVFEPLHMKLTQPNLKHNASKNESVFYEVKGQEYKVSPNVNLSNKWAGGGFISTPSDLIRAGNSLLRDQFISRQTVEKLIEPQRLNNDSVNYQKYALGWRHNKSKRYFNGKKEVEAIHHGGMAVGSQSLLIVFPEYDMVISLLLNRSGEQGSFQLFDYVQPIAQIFLTKLESETSI